MRTAIALLVSMQAVLAAQAPRLDGGRLDPAWFGPAPAFAPSPEAAFHWAAPALPLRGRTIRVAPWGPALWLGGPGGEGDRAFLGRVEGSLAALLERGLRQGLGGASGLSRSDGDLLLSGRVVDARGAGEDGGSPGTAALTFDLKLTDRTTGALLAALHHTLRSPGEEAWAKAFEAWCQGLGRHLRDLSARPLPEAAPPAPLPAAATPARPTGGGSFELGATLARLEALRRDGILDEAEHRALKARAEAKVKRGPRP